MGLIYKATNIINGKYYIGLTNRKLKTRISEHVLDSINEKSKLKFSIFHLALKKYGIENFKWEILEECNLEELESFESLTARFARTADILTQKVFKSLFMFIQEDTQTFIDKANLLEKIKIINNANDLLNIRGLRNNISHEYVLTDITSLFQDVLNYIPILLKIVEKINDYCHGEA